MIVRAARQAALRRSGVAALVLAVLCAGCETPPSSNPPRPILGSPQEPKARRQNEIDVSKVKSRDDIFQIVQFWPQMPWLQKDERIAGFKVPVYFRSSETRLGAFVSGKIYVWLYELVPGEEGRRETKLAYMWELSEAEAMGYRVIGRSILGYYYGFWLIWPSELRLEGKQVEIQFGYERADKRVVLSEPRQFRVPVPPGYQPPAEQEDTER
jgi:hypothetical protein